MYTIGTYPDKTTYVDTDDKSVETFRINSYSDMWTLKQLVDAKNDLGVIPKIMIPNLLDAQADARFSKGQSFGLKLIIQDLANLNAEIGIFHPHNPEAVKIAFEVLGKKVNILSNTRFINKVIESLDWKNQVVTTSKVNIRKDLDSVLMSADAGGFKPLMKLCDKIGWGGHTSSASKSRKYENGETSLSQIIPTDNFEGRDVLIVDDISVGGGTFKGLATKLRECNVGNLYLAVSHMTLQDLGKDPVTNYFEKVFTTNSKFDSYFKRTKNGGTKPSNLEIIKLFKDVR